MYIYQSVSELLDKCHPDEIAAENQFGGRNVKTLKTLSQLRGVIMLACEQRGLEIIYYWPNTIKLATTGSGKAKKAEMIETVCTRYHLDTIDDDTADAIGAAYTHYIQKETE